MTPRSVAAAVSASLCAVLLTSTAGVPAAALRTNVPVDPASLGRDTARDAGHRVEGVKGAVVEVVAVGDIACPPGREPTAAICRHAETAQLTKGIDPDAVLTLGDQQYETGSLFAFRNSYDESWGDLRPRTYPVLGNHEYRTEGASGYYTYFDERQPGPPGYYATNLGSWRVYALNTNCTEISCKQQAQWLVEDLQSHPRACSLMTSHHPRYSSGKHGSEEFMRRFFRIALRHDVDVLLSGHDHHYERFSPMDNDGGVTRRGVVQFVSGGGGKTHYEASGDLNGSRYVDDDTYGVLRLVLRKGSYNYGFRGIDGSKADDGTRSCI